MRRTNFLRIAFIFCSISYFGLLFFDLSFATERKIRIYSPNQVKMSNSYVAVPNHLTNDKKNKSEEGECVGYFIRALDRGCYNNTNSRIGVYADCAGYSATELFDVIDSNFAYVVPYSGASALYIKCKNYRSVAVSRFLQQKEVIEKSAKKNNPACLKAKNDLESAKSCYTAVMASSGSFLDPLPECDSNIGRKIKNAGRYGYSDVTAASFNIASGQYTDKRPNWREAVETVLAGYIMQAQTACGEETFTNLGINKFTPDNQNNFLKDYLSNLFNTNNPNGNSEISSNNNLANSQNDENSSSESGNNYVLQAQELDTEITGNIFVIDAEIIALSKGRLEMILSNPSFYDISNSVDITIAKNIYGTLVTATNKALFNQYINDLSGKLNIFIIKSQNDEGKNECAVYKAIGGQVIAIPNEITLNSKKIHSYMGGCNLLKAY